MCEWGGNKITDPVLSRVRIEALNKFSCLVLDLDSGLTRHRQQIELQA